MCMLFRFIFVTVLLWQVSACSLMNFQSNELKPITVEFAEPNRIQFQGKGAGAGIALMSTMGPVGIALGVAIDEGIAKDIRKAVEMEQSDIQSQIKEQVSQQLASHGYTVTDSKNVTYPKLVIKRYGFKITNGSTDATAAEWVMELHLGPDNKRTVNYPKDFDKDSINSYVLADLKVNGQLGIELLNDSLQRVMEVVYFSVDKSIEVTP